MSASDNVPLRIAVMVDRFPVLSETFVTSEVRELRQEWLYVAPCFLIMGALQLALLSSRGHP